MKTRAFIINNIYLDNKGEHISVGGVETYIYHLCKVMISVGITPEIFQKADINFTKYYDGVLVHGCRFENKKFVKNILNTLPKNEIVVFANDENVYGKYDGIVINLQHGIGWDYQKHKYRGEFFEKLYHIASMKDTFRRIKNSKQADYVVCVDYNYVNWFRTQVNHADTHFVVIPNFTQIPNIKPVKEKAFINIIFARRFMPYRGTRVFTKAIKRILNEYGNVKVTYAGTGPDEAWIKEELNEYDNVIFMQYSCEESLNVHSDKHIAVIPSIGSEGTSLSLLEAMASGCAVICTNVGGMTNIVIDHFNGLIVEPESESIYCAIKELICNTNLMNEISLRGYDTAQNAFSYEKWTKSWKKFLSEIVKVENI